MNNYKYGAILLAVGLGLLAMSLFFAVHVVSGHMRKPWRQFLHTQRIQKPLTPYMIREWMTFDYINYSFNLPPDYLRQSLTLSSAKYPFISIGKEAQIDNVDPHLLLAQVEGAVRQFLIERLK